MMRYCTLYSRTSPATASRNFFRWPRDPRDGGAAPSLVRLVDRFGRQPVDQQIFRRAAIVETGAQIDLEAADPAHLLHARQLGFALAKRVAAR